MRGVCVCVRVCVQDNSTSIFQHRTALRQKIQRSSSLMAEANQPPHPPEQLACEFQTHVGFLLLSWTDLQFRSSSRSFDFKWWDIDKIEYDNIFQQGKQTPAISIKAKNDNHWFRFHFSNFRDIDAAIMLLQQFRSEAPTKATVRQLLEKEAELVGNAHTSPSPSPARGREDSVAFLVAQGSQRKCMVQMVGLVVFTLWGVAMWQRFTDKSVAIEEPPDWDDPNSILDYFTSSWTPSILRSHHDLQSWQLFSFAILSACVAALLFFLRRPLIPVLQPTTSTDAPPLTPQEMKA